jgi:hypothetical protein
MIPPSPVSAGTIPACSAKHPCGEAGASTAERAPERNQRLTISRFLVDYQPPSG